MVMIAAAATVVVAAVVIAVDQAEVNSTSKSWRRFSAANWRG